MFVNSGWKYSKQGQLNFAINTPEYSASFNYGVIELESDFKESVTFDFIGGGVGIGINLKQPIALNLATGEDRMPAVGSVFLNSLTRESMSIDDFGGPCFLISGTGVCLAGVTGSLMFFGVGKGLLASWMAVATTAGLASPVILPTILGSCSGVVATAGGIIGTPELGVTGVIGAIGLREGRRGDADLHAFPWKVTTNNKDYSYVFHSDGRSYWYEFGDAQTSPSGRGRWKVVEDSEETSYVEISWESGSKETWSLPLSLYEQSGTWQTKDNKLHEIIAKQDISRLLLTNKSLNL